MELEGHKFSSKGDRKESSVLPSSGLHKSLETSRRGESERAEMCRKAAAWAWHHRAGGDSAPTRESVAKIAAAVGRDSKVERPKTRFRTVREIESGCDLRDSPREYGGFSETSLSDANELLSLLRRIALLTETLQLESSLDKSSGFCEGGDMSSTRPARSNAFRTSDVVSESCRLRQHTSSRKLFLALAQRSFACLLAPCLEHPASETGFGVPKHRNTPTLRKRNSFSLIQTLCQKKFRANDNLHSTATEEVHDHHHYHHHHHYYYDPPFPKEELQNLEQARVRRHSGNFVVCREVESADQEIRRIRRLSESDIAANCKGFAVGHGAEVQCGYDYSPDGHQQPISENCFGRATPPRRHSENFNVSGKPTHG